MLKAVFKQLFEYRFLVILFSFFLANISVPIKPKPTP
jgi:hypothetical protein